MINRLRRKFVLMNALLILSIFLAILAAFCINAYCHQEKEGYYQLEKVLERGYQLWHC